MSLLFAFLSGCCMLFFSVMVPIAAISRIITKQSNPTHSKLLLYSSFVAITSMHVSILFTTPLDKLLSYALFSVFTLLLFPLGNLLYNKGKAKKAKQPFNKKTNELLIATSVVTALSFIAFGVVPSGSIPVTPATSVHPETSICSSSLPEEAPSSSITVSSSTPPSSSPPSPSTAPIPPPAAPPAAPPAEPTPPGQPPQGDMVWISQTGQRYHSHSVRPALLWGFLLFDQYFVV